MYYNTETLDLKNEVWKDVISWEEIYMISNLGRVKIKNRNISYYVKNDPKRDTFLCPRNIKEKIRKPKLNKHTGYLMVGLNGKGKSQNVTIHSMVAKAFIGDIPRGYNANHKDGNKLNNNLTNLEIITHRENCIHAFKNGLKNNNHRVKYKDIEYYSKSEMRRVLKMSEKIQNKMIKEGSVEVL